jgi:hypothetical protein
MRRFILAAIMAVTMVLALAMSVGADGIPHCC